MALLRQRRDAVDYLVLSDSTIVIDRASDPVVITDKSVDSVAQEKAAAATAVTDKNDKKALNALIEEQQRVRNREGGYWVAQVDPAASDHARTGTLGDVRGAALLSDGAALLVTDFHVLDWGTLLTLGYERGPSEIIAMTREFEDRDPNGAIWPRYKHRDDASAVICMMP
ncbi:hypothetical protein [Spongiactinospora rosea]|uniref:hypothetical protein n=1 Tax=Spongiactinospora rosea TaxID=2248750 RepID=UPI0011C02B35|nr:hypothetical protein [Spongiactinospora rosea]